MPRSGPPSVGISTGPTAVQSQTSVSAPAAPNGYLLRSSTDAVQTTTNKPPMAPSRQAVRSGTPSASRVDSLFFSSPAPPATSPMNTFIAPQQEADASYPISPSSSSLTATRSGPPAPVSPPVPSARPPSRTPRPTPDARYDNERHHDHSEASASTPTPHSAPISIPTSISYMLGGETFYADGKHHFHPFTKWPKPPQQIVSQSHDWVTSVTKTADSETIFRTSVGSGSLTPVPTPTTTGNVSPDSSSNPNNLLPLILGVVLAMLALAALAMVFFRLRRRGRSKYMPTILSCDSETSPEGKNNIMTEATPCVKSTTRITPYQFSSTYTPEHVTTRISHAGEPFYGGDGPSSNPFADNLAVLSSRASISPASLHSVDSVSTNLEFTVPMNTDIQEGRETSRLIDESTSSLELHFASPPVVAERGSLTRSPYWSPTWHYDGQPPGSPSRRGEFWDGERRGGPSGVTTPTSSRPFLLGAESARLRLHALLKEARRV